MSIYRVETDNGTYDVEVADQTQNESSLPNKTAVDEKIAGREDSLDTLINRVKSGDIANLNPSNPTQNPALLALGGIAQRGEAAIANPALALQSGIKDPKTLLDEVIAGVQGKKQGQIGDLIRTTGVGGDYNEALATGAGFLATMGIGNLATIGKGGRVAGKAADIAKNEVSAVSGGVGQAFNDAVKNKTGFLDDVRSAFYDAKATAVEKYGEGLDNLVKDNPEKFVDAGATVQNIKQALTENPKLASGVKRVPGLQKLLNGKDSRLTLREAQGIVNDLQSKVSSGKLKGVGVRPDDIPLLDAIHDLKVDMVDAFPEIKDLRKGYGEVLNKFNMLRSKIKPGALYENVNKNFKDPEIAKSAKELLADAPEIVARMKNYNLIRKFGRMAEWGVGAAIVGAGGSAGLNAIKR